MGENRRRYRARAIRHTEGGPGQWTLARAGNGREQIAIGFKILNPHDLGDGRIEEFLTYYGSFSDAALELTVEALRACGWEGENIMDLHEGGGTLDQNEVELVVEDDEYPVGSGKWTAKIRFINRPSGVNVKDALTKSDAAALGQSLAARIKALQLAKGQAPKQQPAAQQAPKQQATQQRPRPQAVPSGPPEPPPLTDEDIPF